MQTIQQQLDALDEKIKRIEVQPDDYETWRNHPVTQRLLLEVQYQVLEERPHTTGYQSNVNEAATAVNYFNGLKDAFEAIIEWEPNSLNGER
jgi:hypothetical protein